MVVLKCRFGSDTRRIRLETLSFQQLTDEILPKMFNEDISKYHVTYTDPEHDTVFITSEMELKEALVLCPEILVLSLYAKNASPKAENGTEAEEVENGDASPKRKINGSSNGMKEEKRPASPKRQKIIGNLPAPRANYNYTPVRVMVIDALKSLTSGGTIHDIMDYVNENFPVEAKNIKDLHKAIQGRLSSRKEFVKASFKKLDKLTKKECTVWTLSNIAGTKKVTRPHKGKRQDTRVKYDESPSWEDEDEDDDEDSNDTEDDGASSSSTPKDVNYHELVVESLRGLGGRGTIQDIREWLMDHYNDQWAPKYKLHRILSSSDMIEEEGESQDGSRSFRLVEDQPDPADMNEQHRDLLMLSDLSNDLANSASALSEGTVAPNPVISAASNSA